MASMNRLAEEQTDVLEQQIGIHVSSELQREGFDIYRARRVFVTQVVEGNALYGAVNGTAVYAVTLDADDFAYSTCTCPDTGYCCHMAAVFFQYCESAGDDPASIMQRMAADEERVNGHADRRGAELGIEDGPAAWSDWFERKHGQVWKQCRHSLHPLQPVLQELKGKARDWPKSTQRLHWLTAIAFVLELVERAYASTDSYNRYYYEMSFTRAVEPWIAHGNELVAELEPEQLSNLEKEWLKHLNDRLRKASMNESFLLLRWDHLYHTLWERLAAHEEWRQRERAELDRLLEDSAGNDRALHALYAARAYLDYREGRHGRAAEALARTPFERNAALVYSMAEQCLITGDAEALELWMLFLRDRLADCRNAAILRPYLKLCRMADDKQPDRSIWIELMEQHLPYSYPELSAHWFERSAYDRWADLLLLIGIRPDDIDPQDLRTAAKNRPELLIPMFHQAIDEAIQSRNRTGYRTAIKHLKRLEKLYQAAGRTAVWQRYLREFNDKYVRLRALQEELRRGKLMP
jgi:hypothetical protein